MKLSEIKGTEELTEDLKLGKKDKQVIDAFTDKKAMDSKKLSTDGKSLEGLWMGGKDIAWWEGDKIKIGITPSRSVQTVQRALRKIAPKNWIKESSDDKFNAKIAANKAAMDAIKAAKNDGKKILKIAKDFFKQNKSAVPLSAENILALANEFKLVGLVTKDDPKGKKVEVKYDLSPLNIGWKGTGKVVAPRDMHFLESEELSEAKQLRLDYNKLDDVEDKLGKTLVTKLSNQVGKKRITGSDDGWWVDDKLSVQLTKKLGIHTGQGDNFYRVSHKFQLNYDWKLDKWMVLV